MAIKKYKPTTNGRRGMTTLANEEITTSTPTKSLLQSKTRNLLHLLHSRFTLSTGIATALHGLC